MNLAAIAGDEAGLCPLRGDGFAVRPRKCDGRDLLAGNLARGDLHAHGDVRAFVATRLDGDLESSRSTPDREGQAEHYPDRPNRHSDHESSSLLNSPVPVLFRDTMSRLPTVSRSPHPP